MPCRHLHSTEAAVAWLQSRLKGELRTDSRRVQPGDAFVAWPGHAADGRSHVDAALRAGAAACLVEAEGIEAFRFEGSTEGIAALPRLKAATGAIAAALLGRPAERMTVIAVTGTNGKSSTAWWTAQSLSALGRRCGVVGTLGVGEPPLGDAPGTIAATGLTTPDPVTLQASFAQLLAAGCVACAVEASSIGIVEHRLDGTPIRVAQFTNFSRDHLDYHRDMAAYWAAKRALFDWPGLRAAVINVDDEQGAALAAQLERSALDVWTVGERESARLRATRLGYVDGGLAFEVIEGDARAPVRTGLIGGYNASNLLGVIGALRALGVALADAAAVMPKMTPVPGRMQRVDAGRPGQPEVVVDYAHTPDALDKTLRALRPLAAARSGQLACVFGCGGNRDASKRPMMGAIAHQLADRIVVTSDNPRDESPPLILAQILAGMPCTDGVAVIEDRRAAIVHAIAKSAGSDVVLVAGKGHEDYQEVAGCKRPFSDLLVAAEALRAREAA
jgi:UDP-N-acetylmuramyl-tripeptide synthetase